MEAALGFIIWYIDTLFSTHMCKLGVTFMASTPCKIITVGSIELLDAYVQGFMKGMDM